jgi:hypothetical protein
MSFSCQHVRSIPLTPADGRVMQDKLMINLTLWYSKISRYPSVEVLSNVLLSFSGQQGVGNLQTTRHSNNYVTCLQIASAVPLSSTVWYSKFGNIPGLHGLDAFSPRNLDAPVWHSYFVVRGAITPSLKV